MHHLHEESSVNTHLTTIIANEWKNWISDGLAIGYNLSAIAVVFPKLASPLAAAAIARARVLDALDARNQSAEVADTGGLLQVTSYLSGLSGGSRFLLNVTLFTIMREFMFD